MILTVALLLCLGVNSAGPASTSSIDLYDAIEQGVVKAEFTSNGSSSQNSITLNLSNLSDRELNIRLEPGFYLRSDLSNEQDIMITRSDAFVLHGGERTSQPLYGFCTQSFKATPSAESLFSPGGYAQGEMAKLANYLNASPCDPNLEQKAIWAMQGDIPLAATYSGNRDEDESMRKFLADLKDQNVPDYIVDYGNVLNAPLERTVHQLRGRFSFSLDRPTNVTLVLKRPDGSVLTTYYTDRFMDIGYYTTNFTYSAGLSSGTYTFELSMANGEVLTTAIEV